MRAYKYIYYLLLFILSMTMVSGCSATNTSNVPADFIFILDARSAEADVAQHINIQINGKGEGRYERYNTGGSIVFDENGKVVYERSQVVEAGDFKVSNKQLNQLWVVINENNFYQLTEDYRLSLGFSYAFIVIEANGQRHRVDNIGMEVPEIGAIVEETNSLLPEGVVLDYGKGWDFSN